MEFTYSNDGFLPYDSFDFIFNERQMPEFGKVASPYLKPLTTWKFYLANGQSEVPFGVMNTSYDDSEWALVNCPSTWQTEGFGLPQNLIYDYPIRLAENAARRIPMPMTSSIPFRRRLRSSSWFPASKW